MSECMIVRRGGGAKGAFAYIVVSYPVGSTCICSDGTRTLQAKDTSGSFVFNIPYAATWTVSCFNVEETATESVTISEQGQTKIVMLSYRIPSIYQEVEYFYTSSDDGVTLREGRYFSDCYEIKCMVITNPPSDNIIISNGGIGTNNSRNVFYTSNALYYDYYSGSTRARLIFPYVASSAIKKWFRFGCGRGGESTDGIIYTYTDSSTILSSGDSAASNTIVYSKNSFIVYNFKVYGDTLGVDGRTDVTKLDEAHLIVDCYPVYLKEDPTVIGWWDSVGRQFHLYQGGTPIVGPDIT